MARLRPRVSADSLLLPVAASAGGAACRLSEDCAAGTEGGGWNTASTPQSVCVRSVPAMAVTVSILLQHLWENACMLPKVATECKLRVVLRNLCPSSGGGYS